MDPLFYNIQKTSHYSSNSNHIYIICSLVTVLVLVLHHVLVLVFHHVSVVKFIFFRCIWIVSEKSQRKEA